MLVLKNGSVDVMLSCLCVLVCGIGNSSDVLYCVV